MKFSEYLQRRQKKLGLNSAKEHFVKLGGKKNLSIDLRYFQAINSGLREPPIDLLINIFCLLDQDEKLLCLKSFFNTKSKAKKDNLEYFLNYLSVLIDSNSKSTPATPQTKQAESKFIKYYSDSQIDFLSKNISALSLWNQTLLNDAELPKNMDPITMNKMSELKLLNVKNGKALFQKDNYMFPINTMQKTRKGIEDIFIAHTQNYFSLSDQTKQIQGMRLCKMPPDFYEDLRQKLEAINKLIASNSFKTDPNDNNVINVFWSFFLRELNQDGL